jgi:ankyrin repeat protein
MDAEDFRKLIEAGDTEGLRTALKSDSQWANRTIVWHLNQCNESDPLHYVSDCVANLGLAEDRAAKIAALLLQFGAEIEGSPGRESPLIAATSLGVAGVAELLAEAGADIEATALFGARPLHWAAYLGLPTTVETLLERGAAIEAKCTEFGATPLFWSAHSFSTQRSEKHQALIAVAKVLIAAGARIDTTNKEGMTAAQCARRAKSPDMYELLRQHSDEEQPERTH